MSNSTKKKRNELIEAIVDRNSFGVLLAKLAAFEKAVFYKGMLYQARKAANEEGRTSYGTSFPDEVPPSS